MESKKLRWRFGIYDAQTNPGIGIGEGEDEVAAAADAAESHRWARSKNPGQYPPQYAYEYPQQGTAVGELRGSILGGKGGIEVSARFSDGRMKTLWISRGERIGYMRVTALPQPPAQEEEGRP